MQQQTVNQHYVTAGYLAGFTLGGTRYSPFFIYSPAGSPVRESVPDRVGVERHYHDIDIPRFRPDHLEVKFQEIEGPACALFRTLSANPGRPLITDSEKESALMFFAVQAARVPQSKAKYEGLMLGGGRAFLEAMAYSPESFSRVVSVAQRYGVPIREHEQERLRETVDGGHIFPIADKTQLAVGIFRLAYAILDKLDGMHYTLWYSKGPDWFVCSDHPVGIFYSVSADGDMLENPLALENPIVELHTDPMYMPLAHNVALVIHRRENAPIVQGVNQRMVGVVNAITISHAQRFICSPTRDFVCVLPDKRLVHMSQT
jgi:Protein of unknown function (DUF4238)